MRFLLGFIITTIFLNTIAYSGESKMTVDQLPQEVQTFLTSVQNSDSNLFETLLVEDSIIDDWGKIIRGKNEVLKFSETHLVGAKGVYEIDAIKMVDGNALLDGTWKSDAHTGPTRFIFEIKDGKIKKLVISSPRWIDRVYISISSVFN